MMNFHHVLRIVVPVLDCTSRCFALHLLADMKIKVNTS